MPQEPHQHERCHPASPTCWLPVQSSYCAAPAGHGGQEKKEVGTVAPLLPDSLYSSLAMMVHGYSSVKWPLSLSLLVLPLQAKSHSFLLPRRNAQMLHHLLLFLLHPPIPLQSNCPQLSLFGCVNLPELIPAQIITGPTSIFHAHPAVLKLEDALGSQLCHPCLLSPCGFGSLRSSRKKLVKTGRDGMKQKKLRLAPSCCQRPSRQNRQPTWGKTCPGPGRVGQEWPFSTHLELTSGFA